MSKRKKIVFAVIVIAIIAVIIICIVNGRRNNRNEAAQTTEATFITSPLTKQNLSSSISLTGTIASADTRTLTSGLTNIEVTAVHVSVGDYVKAGDVICEFDTSTIEDELEEAQSSYNLQNKKSSKTLGDAQDGITQAEEAYNDGVVENNNAVADAKYAYDVAVSNQTKAKEAYDAACDAVEKTKKEYNKIKENKSTLKKEMEEAQKKYEAAKAEYDKAATVSDVELTSAVYDTYKAAEADYEKAKRAYEAVEQAKKSYEDAKNAKTEASTAYDQSGVDVESAYAKYVSAQDDAAERNEQNAKAIEDKKEDYSITSMETTNNMENQQNQVDQVADKLNNCVVTAPIDGVVTSVFVEVGDTYKGENIVEIQDMENFVVDATVDEYDISDISKGMKAVIKTDATDDTELEGEVTFVAPTPNSTQGNAGDMSNTSNYSIQITLKDKNDRLRIGMTAKTSIVLDSRENVFAVPYDSIHTGRDGTSYITVLEGNGTNTDTQNNSDRASNRNRPTNVSFDNSQATTRQIQVQVGMESDYYVEITSDELTEGMQVVTTIANTSNSDSERNAFMMPGGNMGGFEGGGEGGGNRGGGRPSGGPGGGL